MELEVTIKFNQLNLDTKNEKRKTEKEKRFTSRNCVN